MPYCCCLYLKIAGLGVTTRLWRARQFARIPQVGEQVLFYTTDAGREPTRARQVVNVQVVAELNGTESYWIDLETDDSSAEGEDPTDPESIYATTVAWELANGWRQQADAPAPTAAPVPLTPELIRRLVTCRAMNATHGAATRD